MSFQTGIPALDSLRAWDGIKEYKLETPLRLMEGLGNPQNRLKTIHVTGTNGKGSVCTFLASIIHASGKSVGQMCSPHLSDVCERLLVNGKPVEKEIFSRNADIAVAKAKELGIQASFFEVGVAASFLSALELELEWLVVEVGMGGRLDATNTISKPEACVITSIGFDHTKVLGETLSEIAGEKAGILKVGAPAFLGEMDEEAVNSIELRARDLDITLTKTAQSDRTARVKNEHLARLVARELGFLDTHIEKGVSQAFWPGRLELIEYKKRQVLLDVFHNPDGEKVLARYLEGKKGEFSNLVYLLSFLNRKDYQTILANIEKTVSSLDKTAQFVFTETTHPHCEEVSVILEKFGKGEAETDQQKALNLALQKLEENDLLIIGGSLFLVGELRPSLVDGEFKTILSD